MPLKIGQNNLQKSLSLIPQILTLMCLMLIFLGMNLCTHLQTLLLGVLASILPEKLFLKEGMILNLILTKSGEPKTFIRNLRKSRNPAPNVDSFQNQPPSATAGTNQIKSTAGTNQILQNKAIRKKNTIYKKNEK